MKFMKVAGKLGVFTIAFTAIFIWMMAGLAAAFYLTSPAHENFDSPLINGQLPQEISIHTDDDITISAAFLPGSADRAVILLAGIRGNRKSMISRAEYYSSKGFSVLLPDLRGTGKSEGNKITFGWAERKDLIACYNFLRSQGIKKIAAHGCSLGAATITYALPEINDLDFIVLESCYDNLDNAFNNRIQKFALPEFVYLPIRFWITQITSLKPEEMQPATFIRHASSPVLIIAGDAEEQLRLSETEKIFINCPSPEKFLHIFKGGKHEDFSVRFKEELEQTLDGFLESIK